MLLLTKYVERVPPCSVLVVNSDHLKCIELQADVHITKAVSVLSSWALDLRCRVHYICCRCDVTRVMHLSLRGAVVRRAIKYILSINDIILHAQVGFTYISLDVAVSFSMERNTSLPHALFDLAQDFKSLQLVRILISLLKIKKV